MRQTKQKRTKRRRTTMKRIRRNKVMYGGEIQIISSRNELDEVIKKTSKDTSHETWFTLIFVEKVIASSFNFEELQKKYNGTIELGQTYEVGYTLANTDDLEDLEEILLKKHVFNIKSKLLNNGFKLSYMQFRKK